MHVAAQRSRYAPMASNGGLRNMVMVSVLADADQLAQADVGRLELALPANAIGALMECDGRMLLVHQVGLGAPHRHMADVEVRRDIARDGIVAIQRDRP